jgi:site-specific DNA-methyltransferase (adenine-specific)
LPETSVDSVVCDPPYHLTSIVKRYSKTTIEGEGVNEKRAKARSDALARLSGGFMGKQWDGGDVAARVETWAAVFRVLKPGGHLLAFSGTRTYHRMVCAIEDAGFEVRDQIGWTFGSGFPKSHNAGNGWGTALKPAWEPIVLARKPLIGTVAENVLKHGTGAINIDGCRVEGAPRTTHKDSNYRTSANSTFPHSDDAWGKGRVLQSDGAPARWPANLVHDGSEEVLAAFPADCKAGGNTGPGFNSGKTNTVYGDFADRSNHGSYHDEGSAARFFYTAKADSEDRLGSKHPTVKPLDLMQWLVRLVTPKGGVVLDPFAGTGTTGEAAWREGMRAILIEREEEYQADIARRMELATQPTKRAAVAKTKNKLERPEDLPLFATQEATP